MTDNNHPITPSTELVKQWLGTYFSTTITGEVSDVELTLATQAARWGADQELEECLQWFSAFYCMETWMQKDLEQFRAARRPKPQSQAEEALIALEQTVTLLMPVTGSKKIERFDTIRAALKRLRELERTVTD
jgi:hypothetical protein